MLIMVLACIEVHCGAKGDTNHWVVPQHPQTSFLWREITLPHCHIQEILTDRDTHTGKVWGKETLKPTQITA